MAPVPLGPALGDALEHELGGDEVLGAGVAVELVLKGVLDLLLELVGDVRAWGGKSPTYRREKSPTRVPVGGGF